MNREIFEGLYLRCTKTERARTPYRVDFRNGFSNRGQCFQMLRQKGGGYKVTVDAVKFDEGSDVEELHESVKSAHFSLAEAGDLQGHDLESYVEDYFNRVASTSWAYVTNEGDDIVVYTMNAEEFRALIMRWCGVEHEAKGAKVRCKARPENEKKILEWLNARV